MLQTQGHPTPRAILIRHEEIGGIWIAEMRILIAGSLDRG